MANNNSDSSKETNNKKNKMKSLFKSFVVGVIALYVFSYFTSTNHFNLPGLSNPEEEIFEWKSVDVRVVLKSGEEGVVTYRIPKLASIYHIDSGSEMTLRSKCPEGFMTEYKVIGCNMTLETGVIEYQILN